jgi:hypothetical protein
MLIVYGTACLMLAALLYALVLLGCRNPRKPAWTGDFLVGNVYVPAMIGLLAVGAGCIVNFVLAIGSVSFGLLEAGLSMGIVAVGVVLLKLLRVKKHLAGYAAVAPAGKVVALSERRGQPTENQPPAGPPLKPSSGHRAA